MIKRLLKYRLRKMEQGYMPTKITLKWDHMLEVESWLKSCGLKIADIYTITGYRILGMTIINKGR